MALLKIDFGSQTLQMNENVYVILPDSFNELDPYENNQKKFPTLYLLHGYFGNNTDWTRWTSIERYASDNHIAIVMPSAHNSYYINAVHGEPYYDYIAKELPEFLERILPLSCNPKYKYIAGLSMGGYGALKIGLMNPEKYGLVASLSGVVDIQFMYNRSMEDPSRKNHFISLFGERPDFSNSNNNLFHLVDLLGKDKPYLYLNCGFDDFLFESNNVFDTYLSNKNIEHVYETYPGEHTWDYWDKHIQDVFRHIHKLLLQ